MISFNSTCLMNYLKIENFIVVKKTCKNGLVVRNKFIIID